MIKHERTFGPTRLSQFLAYLEATGVEVPEPNEKGEYLVHSDAGVLVAFFDPNWGVQPAGGWINYSNGAPVPMVNSEVE